MKAKLILAAAFLALMSTIVVAQQQYKKVKAPRWVSEKGFWQIESNIHTPKNNIVYFYTNDNVLIYKENVNGVILDLQKKRVKMRLKRALETAIQAWNRDRLFRNDQQRITM